MTDNQDFFTLAWLEGTAALKAALHPLSLRAISSIITPEHPHNNIQHEQAGLYNPRVLLSLHYEFTRSMPYEQRLIYLSSGGVTRMEPGAWRSINFPGQDVPGPKVGGEVENILSSLHQDKNRLQWLSTVISVYLKLLHLSPFTAYNEEILMQYLELMLRHEGFDAGGLISISRVIARCGKLSGTTDKDVELFLRSGVEEISFMLEQLETDRFLQTLKSFFETQATSHKLKPASWYLLEMLFLKGSVSRGEAMRLCGVTDKTAKGIAVQLQQLGLLQTGTSKFSPYVVCYPATLAQVILRNTNP